MDWDASDEEAVTAALKGLCASITTQDAELKYVRSANLPLGFQGDSLVDLTDEAVLPAPAAAEVVAAKRRVLATGNPELVEVKVERGETIEWHELWIEPVKANGHCRGVACVSLHATPRKTAEEHLRLALLELAHRSKNLLAVVLSLARQSAEESATVEQFKGRFLGRVRSLAVAHDILTDERWKGATVFSLVRSQLTAFQERALAQSTIEGHNAFLSPNATQHVGLALHELVTLAALRGALAHPAGRITVTSALAPAADGAGHDLILRWRETGLPAGGRAEDSPFGRALLERIVPLAVSGSATIKDHDPGAFCYELRLPNTQFF